MTKLYSIINDIKIYISSLHTNPSANLKQSNGKVQLQCGHDIINRTSNNYHCRNSTDISPSSNSSIEFAPSYKVVQFMWPL